MSGNPAEIGSNRGLNRGPAIDLAAGMERLMGDHAMFLRVLKRFADDYHDLAARLHAALAAHDITLAQRIAHTLKGAAAMIEATHLRQLALALELDMKGNGAVPAPCIAALESELARVLAEVDACLGPACVAPEKRGEHEAHNTAHDVAHTMAQLRDMLDVGDGQAPELVQRMQPLLLAVLGDERMAALEAAVGRFDYERALVLLQPGDDAPAPASLP